MARICGAGTDIPEMIEFCCNCTKAKCNYGICKEYEAKYMEIVKNIEMRGRSRPDTLYMYNGKRYTTYQLSKILEIPCTSLWNYLKKGMTIEQIIEYRKNK